MIELEPGPSHPLGGFLERTILEADPTCARHVAEAAAHAAADYLDRLGFHAAAPSSFLGVVLARCLGGIGMPGAARAVLDGAESHPTRRRWWNGLAGAPDFDPVLWHAMDRRLLHPADEGGVLEPARGWRLDLRRLQDGGLDWSELAWFTALRRLLTALCACESGSDGSFLLAVVGAGTPVADASVDFCHRVLRREAANRAWTSAPEVRIANDFAPRRLRASGLPDLARRGRPSPPRDSGRRPVPRTGTLPG